VDQRRLVEYSTIGNEKPKGICGSGLIELIAELLAMALLTERGKFS